jgi:uncharacterized protein YndB with AHSA1/START domain
MQRFTGTATARIDADPDVVFELLTDLDRLPEWNTAIEEVAERPAVLEPGARWIVVMHPPRLPRWRSRSTVLDLDRAHRRFTHRTMNDDGNPSFLVWTWEVDPAGRGSEVRVTWEAHLLTPVRRFLAGRIRRPQLAREVPISLAALRRHLTTTNQRS